MCSLFGLIDHQNVLSAKQKNRILNTNAGERMRPASLTTLAAGCGSTSVRCRRILWNDRELQANLRKTNIQTDSYVAVQLLEKQNALDFASLKSMAETVEGSFVFKVLDAENTFCVVKGDNPCALYRYKGCPLYASTEEILRNTAKRLCLGPTCENIEPKKDDVLRIGSTGRITTGNFTLRHSYEHWWRYRPYYGSFQLEKTQTAEIDGWVDVTKSLGISLDEVQALFDYGCLPTEIEELQYDPALLHELTAELLYAY